jgi:phosphonate metabolism-associated iron-containing alcohol dehydrogenase
MRAESWQYHNPVRVTFGESALESLPEAVAGRRVVLVTFPEAEGLGLVTRLRALLGAGLAGVFADTEPNPDVAGLGAVYERFWSRFATCEAIVAVGGGSTLDTAKTLQVGTPSGRFAELLSLLAAGTPFTPARSVPLLAVPTTAGTGSEVTPWATVWDRGAGKKYSLHLAATWPEAAIVDPLLTSSLPHGATLHSGLDALSHALESIWNVNANPVSDALAVPAAREVLATLPALVADLGDRGLRARMSRASLTAGLAFSNTKTALAHSISYEMTLRYGLPHGLACSFTLPMVLGRALGADASRDDVLSRIFGEPLAAAPARLAAFLREVGVSDSFAAYGVKAEDEERIVSEAAGGVRGKNFIGVAGGER